MDRVIHVESQGAFEVARPKIGSDYVLDFSAVWCGPCKAIAPFYSKCAEKYGSIPFLKVDVDGCSAAAKEYNITAMPTFVFVKDSIVVTTVRGANQKSITEALEKYYNVNE